MIIKDIYKNFGTKEVLKGVSFEIFPNDKIGLVGQNGSGKSTLLKILTGEMLPDSGEILNKIKLGYLKQEILAKDYQLTIGEYIRKETGLGILEEKLGKLEQNLNEDNMYEYDEILNEFLACDGYNFDSNLEVLFNGLKLNKNQNSKICELSGGEKIKVLLMCVLLGNNDLLLLDEPTNNLDIQSVEFLESYIKMSKKPLLVVSHDEKFLDSITNKTFELKNGLITTYPFSYSKYAEVLENEYEKQLAIYNETKEKQAELKNKLSKLNSKSNTNSTKKPKDNDKLARDFKIGKSENKTGALVKKISKELEETQLDPDFKQKETYQFFINETNDKSAPKNIILSDLVCGYDNFEIPKVNLNINYGDRVLIQGRNGSGKTTLINTIMGELKPKSGSVKKGNGVKIGYIEQNTIINKDSTETMFEYVTKDLENIDKGFIFQILNNFQIEYEFKDKPYIDFSAGERTKINLAKLALEKVNVLILDEPTNHLDIEAANILYQAINSFKGTIIAITHNITLIEKLQHNLTLNIETGLVKDNVVINP